MLLPRNKFDDEAVERLALLSEKELLPLADELLTWLQDMNWPIAPAVAELLMPHIAAIEFPIIKIFSSNDDIWKRWVINCLLEPAPVSSITPRLRQALYRIATLPTPGEVDDELDQAAREFLDYLAEA
ncbi:MAG: DUF5071 domain-containing protein [Hymenobacter sp.]|nr:MAG: DUF5071 domain-containing protein [Hymenobacter sp.]